MKTLLHLIIALAIAVGVVGCKTLPTEATEHGSITQTKPDGTKVENKSDYAAYADAKLTLAKQPIISIACPPTGCVMKGLQVFAPGAGGDITAPVAPKPPENAIVGTMREIKEGVIGLAPFVLGAKVVSGFAGIFDRFGGTTAEIASRTQAPQANNTVYVNGSNSSAAIGGSSTSRGPVTRTTTTNTTNTTTTNNNSQNNNSNQGNQVPTP